MQLGMYSFKILESFVAVAERRSFRGAAEYLNRSQSAVSAQIRQLEDELGVALFNRTTRQTVLTPEGAKLLEHARRVIEEMAAGISTIRAAAEGKVGHIAIGSVPSIASTILPAALAAFNNARPLITMRVVESTSADLLKAVAGRRVNFGIGPYVANVPDVDFEPIAEEPILAVLPSSHPLASRQSVTLSELSASSMVLASASAALRGNLDLETGRRGFAINSSFEVTHVHTMLAFARAGLGSALAPAATIPTDLGDGLRVVSVCEPILRRTICIVSATGDHLSPAAEALKTLLADCFRTDRHFCAVSPPEPTRRVA